MATNGRAPAGPRCIAIVGPFSSGKTTLLESILERTGTIERAGRIASGNTVGDSSAEARYMVLPMRPAETEGFSEEALAALVTRDSMIGTGLPLSVPVLPVEMPV